MVLYESLSRLHRFYIQQISNNSKYLPGSHTTTISVGNVTWGGGTGKTVLCAWLATELGKNQTAILSRGYRGGDEAKLLSSKGFLVGVGKDRYAQGERLCQTHPHIRFWILDDGFQHWRLRRDHDVVTLDCLQPFGINGKVIPWGSLRERPHAAIKRASTVILHNSDLVSNETVERLEAVVREYCSSRDTLILRSGLTVTPSSIQELQDSSANSWVVFSGIGNHDSFLLRMKSLAMKTNRQILDHIGFPDHNVYSLRDIRGIMLRAETWRTPVSFVTTEKDIARCPQLSQPPLSAVSPKVEWCLRGGDRDAWFREIFTRKRE